MNSGSSNLFPIYSNKTSQVASRRSRLSNEANQDGESSEDEGEKSNLWLRTLLRSSINEHSTSSSMFVEIGSPPLPAGKRTPSPLLTPVLVPQTVLMEQPRILTIHSQALQVKSICQSIIVMILLTYSIQIV